MGHEPDTEVEKGKELLLPEGDRWDINMLNDKFFEVDVDDILKILARRAVIEDYVAWNYTKNRYV
jgi:hypothetical protein